MAVGDSQVVEEVQHELETDSMKTRTLFCEVHVVQDQYKVSVIVKMISNW
jgi:hypothetical protein